MPSTAFGLGVGTGLARQAPQCIIDEKKGFKMTLNVSILDKIRVPKDI